MRASEAVTALPWYRHFWPWFILALLATAVAASITTVLLAFTNQDSLVRDDWYREGVAINRRLERDQNALRLGLRANASIDAESGEVNLEFTGAATPKLAALEIELSHPTQAHRDCRVILARTAPGRFHGRLPRGLGGRWYARLRPATSGGGATTEVDWQLAQTIQLPAPRPILFGEEG
jgi:hypothetical protein